MDMEDLAYRLESSLDYIGNALLHPDNCESLKDETGGRVMDVSSAITGITSGLFAVAASIDRLADAVAGRPKEEVPND